MASPKRDGLRIGDCVHPVPAFLALIRRSLALSIDNG